MRKGVFYADIMLYLDVFVTAALLRADSTVRGKELCHKPNRLAGSGSVKPESIKIISGPITTLFTSRFLFLSSPFSAKWKKECNYPVAGARGRGCQMTGQHGAVSGRLSTVFLLKTPR